MLSIQHWLNAFFRSLYPLKEITMKKNVGGIDRVLRIVAGLALIALAATGQIGVWGWLGVVVLATGVFSFCGAYTLIGLNTCPIKEETPPEAL
jgi:ABC-type branched-subunit amino acid transport system permease subunit